MGSMKFVAMLLLLIAATASAGDWPGFRGPDGNGLSTERGLPIQWSAEQVAWAVDLPTAGNSSPIVWGDRIFLTGAMEGGAERVLMCFDRATGKMLWHNSLRFDGQEPTHETNPYCSSTPVTDGARIYIWQGSAGMVAYDFDGRQLWRTDLGLFQHIWGNAASPVLFEDTVILHAGPGPRVLLIALDRATGKTVWQKELADAAGPVGSSGKDWKGSWSTPVIDINPATSQPELILSLPQYVAAFNPRTGQEYWRCTGLSDLVYTSPVVGPDVIIAMSGFMGPSIGLRRPGAEASGDVTESHRLWRAEKNPQRIGTGVLLGDHLYMVNEPGVAECIEAKSGNTVWKERLGAAMWGSPIYADGRIYATDNQGTTHIFAPSTKFEPLANNPLPTPQMTRATPAFSDGQIFIRTYDKLYRIDATSK